jgi:hypothetical protein
MKGIEINSTSYVKSRSVSSCQVWSKRLSGRNITWSRIICLVQATTMESLIRKNIIQVLILIIIIIWSEAYEELPMSVWAWYVLMSVCGIKCLVDLSTRQLFKSILWYLEDKKKRVWYIVETYIYQSDRYYIIEYFKIVKRHYWIDHHLKIKGTNL